MATAALFVLWLTLAGCADGDSAGDQIEGQPVRTIDPATVSAERTEADAATVTTAASPGTVEVSIDGTVAAGADTSAAVDTSAIEAETTTAAPQTTTEPTTVASSAPTSTGAAPTTVVETAGWGSPETVRLRFESQVADVSVEDFTAEAMAILTDDRGWSNAGFTFVADPDAEYRVVLAEGPEVDQLCLPLRTFRKVSCQNGPVVALNADRWRSAVDHWELGVPVYRGYLVNHEVGHLLGQRHPKPRCPVAGQPAGVMEQQTAGLEGCVGNPWPRDWEIFYAGVRPVVYAPLPDWGPDPVPENREGQ